LWSDRTKDEKLILAALSGSPEASEERMTRLDIIRTLGAALPEDAANQALTRLMDHRLILAHSFQRQIRPETTDSEDWQPSSTSQDYTYSISFDLLRQWIARKHPLGSLLP